MEHKKFRYWGPRPTDHCQYKRCTQAFVIITSTLSTIIAIRALTIIVISAIVKI